MKHGKLLPYFEVCVPVEQLNLKLFQIIHFIKILSKSPYAVVITISLGKYFFDSKF